MSEVTEIKSKLSRIPLMTVNASPRDGEKWKQRLVEEYTSIVKFVSSNKESGDDWFTIDSNEDGTKFVFIIRF
jgi:ufm1-conjugating enzyme 1